MQVGLGPGHIVLDGDPAPHLQKGADPQFSAHVYCGQTAGWIKMALGMEVGLGPGHIVLDGDWGPNYPPQKSGQSPQFSAHFYCGQTAGCITIPLGVEEGLSPGHSVRWGPSSPSRKRGRSPLPNFRSMSIVVKRLYVSGYDLVRR